MNIEPLDQLDEKLPELPKNFKIFANLAHIGNGFWGVVFMIFFFLVVTNSSVLRSAFHIQYENEAAVALAYFFAILVCAIPVFGMIKMARKQRSGFWLYAIPNGIWVVYCFWLKAVFSVTMGLLSLVFILIAASYLKYMKN